MRAISTAVLVIMLATGCLARAGEQEQATASRIEDHARMIQEWQSLAEQGDADAQVSLGVVFERGLGVEPDHAAALQWYLKAAGQGHPVAQYRIGLMALEGYGTAPDLGMAAKWFQRAAEQGHADAQYRTGQLSRYGPDGVAGNFREEAQWYRRAAEQDHALAQYRLGAMYHEGVGVPQDFVLAYMWFNLAVANGYNGAISDRFDVAAEMTSEQIAEAQQLTRERVAQSRKPR